MIFSLDHVEILGLLGDLLWRPLLLCLLLNGTLSEQVLGGPVIGVEGLLQFEGKHVLLDCGHRGGVDDKETGLLQVEVIRNCEQDSVILAACIRVRDKLDLFGHSHVWAPCGCDAPKFVIILHDGPGVVWTELSL